MTVATAAAGTLTQPADINSMHPYKRHLLQSQTTFGEAGASFSDGRPVDQIYEISPSFSDQQHSVYGSMVSLNNPSKGADNHTKWIEQTGAPALQHNGNKYELSSTSLQSSSDGVQQVLSAQSDSSSQNPEKAHAKRKSRSVDLSHMHLLNGSHTTQLTSTNESVADLSHQYISRYLGEGSKTSLVPRLKTIEMYRKNVKKSKDPNLLFQYAQYMLQTALTMESSDAVVESESNERKPATQASLKKKYLKEAQHYLKKLSVKGYADAQYLLGDVYASGAFGKIENKEAFVLFQAAAKHGHIESAYRTAYCFEEGLGTTRDSRKALDFLKFSASRNHSSAMYKLGLYSFYGRMGLSTDVNTKQNGIKWLSRAAARANDLTCAAPYELAKIYEQGFLDIVIPDEKYAMELYIQAASLGHVPSATLLGQVYETGNQTAPQDTSLSVHYYTQAALKGDPVAMLGLCAWYLLGAAPAFEKDENEAFQWALRASTAGYPKAQFTLGYFYEKGKGCEVNLDSAWKWYEKAAKSKDPRALIKMKHHPHDSQTSNVRCNKKNHKKSKSVSTINLFKTFDNDQNADFSPLVQPTGIFTDLQPQQQSSTDENFVIFGKPQSKNISFHSTSSFLAPNDSNSISVPHASATEVPQGLLSPAKSETTLNVDKNTNKNKSDRKKKDCIIM